MEHTIDVVLRVVKGTNLLVDSKCQVVNFWIELENLLSKFIEEPLGENGKYYASFNEDKWSHHRSNVSWYNLCRYTGALLHIYEQTYAQSCEFVCSLC